MADRVRGKVARVNSDRELIINRGSAHHVNVGTHFYVKDKPVEVVDPDTGHVLGEVSPIKIVVRVAEVAEQFSIARTFRTRKIKVADAQPGNDAIASALGSWRQQLQPPRPAVYETKVETLRLDPKKGAPIKESDSVVTVGDDVESVLEGEDIDPVTTTLFR